VLRRVLIALLVLALLPSIAAAGLGVWTSVGGLQQHVALDLLLTLLLGLEGWELRQNLPYEGLVQWWEGPLLVLAAVLLFGAGWDRRLPRWLQPLVDLPEMLLATLGLVAAGAILAMGAALDRPLFWSGLLLAAFAGSNAPVDRDEPRPGADVGWRARSNRWRRAVLAAGSAGVLFYGVTSLWEGATYRNPVFRLADFWTSGPGASPWLSGGVWLLAGGAIAAWLGVRARHRLGAGGAELMLAAGAGVALAGISALLAPASHLAIARGLSGIGLLVLAVAAGPFVVARRLPERGPLSVLDPRQIGAWSMPLVAWGALCLVRGLTISMWTVPPELPPEVVRVADDSCVFGIRADPTTGDVTWSDRCAIRLGHASADGATLSWRLDHEGADEIEELLGPDPRGTMYAAISTWTDTKSRLVLLAVEGDQGPRSLPGQPERAADAVHGELPAYFWVMRCWVASWIPVPGTDDEVVVGCENLPALVHLRTSDRSNLGELDLTGRVESGAFSSDGSTLYGVSLWGDADLVAWSWPPRRIEERRVLDEVGRRTLGAFNWTAEMVPEPDRLWVSRFVEGEILVLDPETLEVADRVRLSPGVRALTYDPARRQMWAAAAYTGLIWRVDVDPPYARRSWALCGEARDVAVDASGRATVGTDCGVFRIDPG